MMFNQAPRCAFLLALAASLAHDRVEGFLVAGPVGCGALHRGLVTTTAGSLPHAAVRGCTCGACVGVAAAAGFGRATLGGKTRGRGCVALGLSMEADGAPAAAVPEFDLTDTAVEELWRRVKKQLISVGKGGVKASHIRSLNSLVAAHTLVKVKVNIPNANLAEVGLELAGKRGGGGGASEGGGGDEGASSPAVDVSVVTVNSNQNTILFANTEFLAAQARGEVFDSERSA